MLPPTIQYATYSEEGYYGCPSTDEYAECTPVVVGARRPISTVVVPDDTMLNVLSESDVQWFIDEIALMT